MADESIRSLIATLGFEVDTTGADLYKARFKKLESDIAATTGRINSLKPLKFPRIKTGKAGLSLGQRLKASFLKAFTIDPKTGLRGFTESLKAGLATSFRAARTVAFAGAVALAAAIGKGFFTFKNIEQAEFVLKLSALQQGLDFSKIKAQIEAIKEDADDLVSDLEIWQAIGTGVTATGDFEGTIENMRTLIKFSKLLGQTLPTTQAQISNFIKTGALEGMERFGVITHTTAEMLKLAGTGFSRLAIRDRAELIRKTLAEQTILIAPLVEEYKNSVGGSMEQVGNFISRKTQDVVKKIVIGFKAISKATGIDIKTLDEIDKKSSAEGFFPDPSKIIKEAEESFDKINKKNTLSVIKESINATNEGAKFLLEFIPKIFGGTLGSTTANSGGRSMGDFEPRSQGSQAVVTNNITVNQTNNINGGDTEKIKRVIGSVFKDAAQIELRKTPDTALPTRSQ